MRLRLGLAFLLAAALSAPADAGTVGTAKSADGVAIRYESFGRGEPAVVLVHCWSCDRHLWDAAVPELAKSRRVVSLDLAGHGESGRARKAWSIEAFGGDVKAVVEALHLKKVVLVGHSMGGPVILEAARGLGGRVVGLVPVDTLINVEDVTPPEQVAQIMGSFEKDYSGTVDHFTRQFLFLPKSDPALVDRVAKKNASAPPEIATPSLRAVLTYDPRPALKEVRVPARAINSDRFPTGTEVNRRYFASYDVALMSNVGHYVMLEDAARFSELLVQAIADLISPAPPKTAASKADVGAVVDAAQFDRMFPPATRDPFYTYAGFVTGSNAIAGFCTSGDRAHQARECAAFLANVSHETGLLGEITEDNCDRPTGTCPAPETYCDKSRTDACACAMTCNERSTGKGTSPCSYYGRGPVNLSWNYNYCAASAFLFSAGDTTLVREPWILATDAAKSWSASLWYWMTQPAEGPSSHAAILGDLGFGATIKAINGDLECNQKERTTGHGEMLSRVCKYDGTHCDEFKAETGEDTGPLNYLGILGGTPIGRSTC